MIAAGCTVNMQRARVDEVHELKHTWMRSMQWQDTNRKFANDNLDKMELSHKTTETLVTD